MQPTNTDTRPHIHPRPTHAQRRDSLVAALSVVVLAELAGQELVLLLSDLGQLLPSFLQLPLLPQHLLLRCDDLETRQHGSLHLTHRLPLQSAQSIVLPH